MSDWLTRTELLLGNDELNKIKKSSVIIFGIGGVGSFTAEALARTGVGRIGVCDADVVSFSNINRQLYALNSTIGNKKTEVAQKRILDINPEAIVDTYDFFFDADTLSRIDLSRYDYIVDAIDSMESKVLLISEAHRLGIGIISALSAGNKLDPLRFEIEDIFSTSVCPIAKILRKRLKDIGVTQHKVVYSKEPPVTHRSVLCSDNNKRVIGSVAFVPSVMGLLLAKETVFDLIERNNNG